MIIVSDTSCIINLISIQQIHLLENLFGKVIIPHAVYEEIVIEGAGKQGAEQLETYSWIEVRKCNNENLLNRISKSLDDGESEAIVLAIELKADLLLIDEAKGRTIARENGIPIIGLLGVLVRAKQKGHISNVKSLMDELISHAQFRIADELYFEVLKISGE